MMLVVILKGIHAMNKKGMTLMEVIISIAMLSVALVFMYGLMVNLQHKKNVSDAYADNLIKIADIETQIQKEFFDFISFGQVVFSEAEIKAKEDSLSISINKNTKTVGFSPNEIIIKDGNESIIKKWTLNNNASSISYFTAEEYKDKKLFYQYKIYFKDAEEKIIDFISIPIYFQCDNITIN